ncbi:MAG: universal stress protein [Pseudomonadota bacterium]
MYQKILIPTLLDNPELLANAVNNARLLLAPQGTITLLNVVEEIPVYAETYVVTEALTKIRDDAKQQLDEMAAALGSDLHTKVVKGHAGRTIMTEMEAQNADLTIISSHRPGLADYFLGSTANHVVRYAQCPVLVLR